MADQSLPLPAARGDGATGDQLFHVADCAYRYAGEEIAFHTCLRAQSRRPGRTVSVSLPVGLTLLSFTPQIGPAIRSCRVTEDSDGLVVEWALADELAPGDPLEFTVLTRPDPAEYDRSLSSRAAVWDASGRELASETAGVWIATRSRYMPYLPEIYHENDFLNRLLMLFESFWKPLEAQIDQSDAYYDVRLTPSEFLPWMASWIGITWDESLPEERKRELLHSAVGLYQSRGTRQALLDYLTLYTHGEVEIVEHRAQNFVLGRSAPLGKTIALGRSNLPHSFSVHVRVGRDELIRRLGETQANPEQLFRQRLEAIVETQKPAHTTFEIYLQFDDATPILSKESDHGQ
jgi:phage tail-like protein